MVDATLSRDGTSVDIPLVDSSSGTPLISKDLGKPNLDLQETGDINPRHIDQWSGNEQYTLLGRFTGSNAYQDARTLFSLIKSNSNGNDLTLDIPLSDFDDQIIVAPAATQDESLSMSFVPGHKDWVEVDLATTRVSQTLGGADQPANIPTAAGSGPIQISDGSTTVDLVNDIEVSWACGRPNSSIRRRPTGKYPRYYDKHKTSAESFELSCRFTDSAVSMTNDIVGMFGQQLGRQSLTLDFNGVYGLGEFNVIPDGSQALRHTRESGRKGTTMIPTVNLRRVYSE